MTNILSLVDTEKIDEVQMIVDIRESFKREAIREVLKMQYELGMLGDDFQKILALKNETKKRLDESKLSTVKNRWFWITINPEPKVSVAEFQKCVANVASRSFVKQAMYVYEQRGETEDGIGKGFHCHMLIERDMSNKHDVPAKIIERIRNTCKKVLKLHKNNPYIQIVDAEYAKDKIRYMLGDKDLHKEKKDLKLTYDKLWRDRENIEHSYGNIQIT